MADGLLAITACRPPETFAVPRPTSESIALACDIDLEFGADTYLVPARGDFLVVVDWRTIQEKGDISP